MGFLHLADFGLSFVITRQVAYTVKIDPTRAVGGNDFVETRTGWPGVSDIYRAGRHMFRWVTLAALIILVVIYQVVLPHGKLLTDTDRKSLIVWYLLGASSLLVLQSKPRQAVLDGLAKLYLTRFLGGSYQFLRAIVVATVLLLGGRLLAMSATVLVVTFLYYVVYRIAICWQVGHRLTGPEPLSRTSHRKLLRVAGPMGILMLGAFLTSAIQVPLVGLLLGPDVVTGYYVAQKIVLLLAVCIMVVVHSHLPHFTRDLSTGACKQAVRRMKTYIAFVAGVSLTANVCFIVLGKPLMILMIGADNIVSNDVLLFLAVNSFVMTTATAGGHFVLASGSNPFVLSTLASGLLNLLLCIIVVPRQGMIGVPLSMLVAGLCTNYWYNPYRAWRLIQSLNSQDSRKKL